MEKVRLIGPIVERRRNSVANESLLRRKLGYKPTPAVIYGAISGPKVERDVLFGILVDALKEISTIYQIVVSRGDPDGSVSARQAGGVKIFGWIEDQDDFVRASDLVISRAGHGTIMKSMVYGKPMILIPIPDHTEQYGNARRAVSLHVAEVIDQAALNQERLQTDVERVLGDSTYAEASARIGKEAAALDAVSKACEIVERLGNHG
jgi:UDP-N-acetylglucosamine--N-acetylmuramyl-(pentapeptide) pyrophosphoryl-undecaprenol N-acetylglucosamine transferase